MTGPGPTELLPPRPDCSALACVSGGRMGPRGWCVGKSSWKGEADAWCPYCTWGPPESSAQESADLSCMGDPGGCQTCCSSRGPLGGLRPCPLGAWDEVGA